MRKTLALSLVFVSIFIAGCDNGRPFKSSFLAQRTLG